MSDKPTDTINAVIEEVGLSTPITNAEWGRRFADVLFDSGDDEAIRYALSDAGESYRSSALSKTRKAARSAVDAAISQRGGSEAAGAALQRQLAFEVSFEGAVPCPLIDTTHEFISAAVAYVKRQYQGVQENLLFLQHAEQVTKPYPGQTVRSLIDSGLLSPDAFVIDRAA